MATSHLSLEGVSYVLPNGETLFSDLNENFDQRHTGLVGRNGSGKTVLARILSGQLQPTRGRCVRTGAVHYLAQQVSPRADTTVADLAGVQGVLDALKRIEADSTAQVDFDVVADRWDIEQQLGQALAQQGLTHLDASTPTDVLSGGEAMRVALIGAQLSDADFLILDEPSNHLDQHSRRALIEWLHHWQRGLLVPSVQALERLLTSYQGALVVASHDHAFLEQLRLTDLLVPGTGGWALMPVDHLAA